MSGATWDMDEPLDIDAIKEHIEQSSENMADFMEHAPADLNALIAEVERLRDQELLWYTT